MIFLFLVIVCPNHLFSVQDVQDDYGVHLVLAQMGQEEIKEDLTYF